MYPRHFIASMWLQACDALDRAEGLQKHFFTINRAGQAPAWRPPVDLLETEHGLLVRAAIPDAQNGGFEVSLENGRLYLSGVTAFPSELRPQVIHRLEIPFGRVERAISLPPGQFELDTVTYEAGCLQIRLTRTGPRT
jgi:HSP20 family protein